MVWNPKIEEARSLEDLKVNGVYLVRFRDWGQRAMMYEGNVGENVLGFMEETSSHDYVNSWRTLGKRIAFENNSGLSVVVFTDGRELVQYDPKSIEFKQKHALLEKAKLPFT